MSNKQKILAIFDLSRTLLIAEKMGRQQYFDKRMDLEQIKANDKYQQYSIYWRNGREQFLDYFMNQQQEYFDIGIWSSQDRDKTSAFARSFFGKHFRNLLFVSATNREQYDGPQKDFSAEPISIKRDLNQIKLKFSTYDLNNIVIISTLNNQIEEFKYNDLILPKMDPNFGDIREDQTLQGLMKYLTGLSVLFNKNKIQDIRTGLRSKSLQNMQGRIRNTNQQYREYL